MSNLVAMNNTTTTKQGRGRPKNTHESVQMHVTISKQDMDILIELAELTGARPATTVRNIVVESRPIFQSIIELIKAKTSGNTPKPDSVAAKLLRLAEGKSEINTENVAGLLDAKK